MERIDDELEIPSWMQPMIHTEGYKVHLPPKDELEVIAERNVRVLGIDAAVTCAILYRCWDAVGNESAAEGDSNTSVSVFLAPDHNLDSAVVVSCVHLDASDERKRVSQLTKSLRRARALFDTHQPEPMHPISAIIAGDMNQEFLAGSCVAAMLEDQPEVVKESDLREECASSLRLPHGVSPTEPQMKQWNELHQQAKDTPKDFCIHLSRVDTGATRSAHDHNKPQTMAQWRLDHLIHTDNIRPVSAWSTLEADHTSCESGLPNSSCPSDHLPIAAVFAVQPGAMLNETEKEVLISRLQSLTSMQKTQLQDLEEEMETELSIIKSKLPETPENRMSKKNKCKPAPEVVAFMRKRRSLVKETKASHLATRQKLGSSLTNRERLALQAEFGYGAQARVQRG